MEMTNTSETITIKRTIEKDGVLIEETIQVPNEEANLLASYLASNPTEEVQHDHQEEHSSEVNGKVEAIQAKEEEGTGGEKAHGVPGNSPEAKVLKDENTIELKGDYDGSILDPNGLLFGVPIVEEANEEEHKESAAEFAARDSMKSGAMQVDGVIVIDDPTYPAEDLPNDLFDSGYTDDEENQDIYAMMNDAYSDFDDDDDDVYEMLEVFDDDE